MFNFVAPTLDLKKHADEFLFGAHISNCELCFGNLFMWSVVYDNLISISDDMLVVKNKEKDKNIYSFPVGRGDLKKSIEMIISDAKSDNAALNIYGLSEEQVKQLDELFPKKFTFNFNRDLSDYVYSREKLALLSGKKYHGKRNHISSFIKQYPNWCYEEINASNVPECLQMHRKWIEVNTQSKEDSVDYENEYHAAEKAMKNFDALGLKGGLIRIDGEVVAYTFGEALSDEMFCTHVEKAFSDMRGAYPIINREFAKNSLGNFQFVNREEDLGIEGLRRAKLSYKPEFLVEKYVAVYKD